VTALCADSETFLVRDERISQLVPAANVRVPVVN